MADTSPKSQIITEFGVGHEVQTSPLIRLSPQDNLISIDGLQQLANSNVQASVQAFDNWQLSEGFGLSLAGDARLKRIPGSPDLDFGSFSVQPALHRALTVGTVGWGLSNQQLEVAGRPFRNMRGTQFDWTVADTAGNHWAVIAEFGTNRHPDEYSDLDAATENLVVQRHISSPVGGIDALDVSAYLSQDRNLNGFEELSSKSLMLVSAVSWVRYGIRMSAGFSLQGTKFAESAFADEPVRIDRACGVELSAEYEFATRHTLRLEYNEVRNFSTIPLYDNQYQQIALKLRTTW